MRRQPHLPTTAAVHLVGTDAAGAAGVMDGLGHVAVIRRWEGLPPAAMVGHGDHVIIDAKVLGLSVHRTEVGELVRRARLWLMMRGGTVHASWLVMMAAWGHRLRVIDCSGDVAAWRPLLTALHAELSGPPLPLLTRGIVARDARLAPLLDAVESLCGSAWDIRHPIDLAAALGIPRDHLRRACVRAGFLRIEHFMTNVRALAVEVLVREHGIGPRLARRRAGIGDASNARRQLGRARASGVRTPAPPYGPLAAPAPALPSSSMTASGTAS